VARPTVIEPVVRKDLPRQYRAEPGLRRGDGAGLVSTTDRRRILVVSHPCVVPENQSVYAELQRTGWDVDLVVPAHWPHDYRVGSDVPPPLPALRDRTTKHRVALAGRPQRHFYLLRPGRVLGALRPDILFVEEECYSASALQWGKAAVRLGIPFGIQADENLDRRLPMPVRALRSWVLSHAAFVAARSPTSADFVTAWGATGEVHLIPHAVPPWPVVDQSGSTVFCIGFAGRLVPEKGIWDLVRAAESLEGPIRIVFVGEGELREQLERTVLRNGEIVVKAGLLHAEMAQAYRSMDVLVLPSRTTPTWAEQFGRVLVEAMWCGIPVIGSDSGAIPWVIETTGGGVTFAEGDIRALARALSRLRSNVALRQSLSQAGQESIARQFSATAVACALNEVLLKVTTRKLPYARSSGYMNGLRRRVLASETRLKTVVKPFLFSPDARVRTIRGGPAKGVLFLLCRRRDLQRELGLYETELRQAFMELTPSAGTIYDVGASDGYTTLLMAALAPSAKIVAFEPDGDAATLLKRNLALNPSAQDRVKVLTVAVGGPVHPAEEDVPDNGVRAVDIDGLVAAEILPPPQLIKIDVEGAEADVLRGAMGTLQGARPAVITETHSSALELECQAILTSAGYHVQVVKNAPWRVLWPELRDIEHNRWLVARPSESC
jgi:FkbM family methyltransferase